MLLTHVSKLRHVLLKFDGSWQLQRVEGPVLAVGVRDVAARILAAGITGALVSCKKVDASSTVFAFFWTSRLLKVVIVPGRTAIAIYLPPINSFSECAFLGWQILFQKMAERRNRTGDHAF